ncbi:PTS system cellobiose-specific IIC component [Olsenella profusa DSM 13989]|uniref:PTS sugar transporter subunit IIC n=1 Tax=Olsenella profusa TaxID=138595 RepID=UPI0027878CE6|nr:PTS sugar transporter subunit IIC [Olsenella profusa]MDP9859496.1 PTS system cellobiose-specific IIC component [Olsenella profusa DSM 13989]
MSSQTHTASADPTGGFLGRMEGLLMPLAESVGKNRYLLTLRDSFSMIMPLLIIGSMFTLVASFPITAWTDFLAATTIGDYTLKTLIAIPANATVSLMSIFIAYNIGLNFAGYLGLKDRPSAGIVSLASWLILMPQLTSFTPEEGGETFEVASLNLEWLGAKGVFIGIIAGFLSVALYAWCVRKDWTIKMPAGVPPVVARSFSALIPMAVTFAVVWVVRVVFVLTPWGDAFTFVYAILQLPLQHVGGTVWSQALVYLFAHFLWFFGIHGTNITDAVYNPVLIPLSLENASALQAGMALPNVINQQFEQLFATYGGAGSTLSLLIAALIICRSKRIHSLAKMSLLPGIFEINEPVIFGLPIVMNPVMAIPFLLVPMVNIFATYAVMAAGLVPICNGTLLPWTVPPIVSGFLCSGWQGALWQALMVAVGVLIYLPFIGALDRMYLKEEAEAAKVASPPAQGVGGSPVEAHASREASDIDIDSIDLDAADLKDL